MKCQQAIGQQTLARYPLRLAHVSNKRFHEASGPSASRHPYHATVHSNLSGPINLIPSRNHVSLRLVERSIQYTRVIHLRPAGIGPAGSIIVGAFQGIRWFFLVACSMKASSCCQPRHEFIACDATLTRLVLFHGKHGSYPSSYSSHGPRLSEATCIKEEPCRVAPMRVDMEENGNVHMVFQIRVDAPS